MEAPKHNRGRVMKMAWSMFRTGKKIGRRILTFAECMKEAWRLEKNTFKNAMNMFNLRQLAAKQEKERNVGIKTRTCSMAFASDSLVNYYANNRYNGD